jgi:hypothetical protein
VTVTQATAEWLKTNQAALSAEIRAMRAVLAAYAGQPVEDAPELPSSSIGALDVAAERLGLSSFERKIAVLCAAMELEGSFAALCALAQADASRPYPTFGLALAAFPDAHWSALAPNGPLRRYGLIEIQRGAPLTSAALRIEEAFLHDLAGIGELDPRLTGILTPFAGPERLANSHLAIAEQVARILQLAENDLVPCVELTGPDARGKSEIAAEVFALCDRRVYALEIASLQLPMEEIDIKARACEREARLRNAGLFIDAHELPDGGGEGLGRFLERLATPAVVATRQPLRLRRQLLDTIEVCKPTRTEQRQLWMAALCGSLDAAPAHEYATEQAVLRVTAQFDFDAAQIRAVAQRIGTENVSDGQLRAQLWTHCRNASRNELCTIAQKLEGRPRWENLVLPAEQVQALQDIVAHARNRSLVHDDWAMGGADGRGLGVSALFHGPSGTGKTLAAEVIGTELNLDVYRVDLSQLVSKFVGETEKNLRRVFDAADGGGAILLFDECDAIFGRRGEVEHGQDRYANLEVSYLLQRMESYRGIAVLTTNMRSAIDPAFLRRLRFVVGFPFPGYEQRVAIWRRALSPAVPVEGIDFERLARLNVAGGSIRNIAMHAAFDAAERTQPVTMGSLHRVALSECAKLERAPSEVEIGGWL